jgi:hypothetical protein
MTLLERGVYRRSGGQEAFTGGKEVRRHIYRRQGDRETSLPSEKP